jgi:hypothetical protein
MSGRSSAMVMVLAALALFAPNGAHAGFYGNYVTAIYARGGYNTQLYSVGPVLAGPGVEVPALGASNIAVDASNTGFRITFPTTWALAAGTPAFDGVYLYVAPGVGVPAFTVASASLSGTSIAGMGANRVSWDASHIFVNLAGLGSVAAGSYIDVAASLPVAPYNCSLTASPTSLPVGGGSVAVTATCLGDPPTTYYWGSVSTGQIQSTSSTFTTKLVATSGISMFASNSAGTSPQVSIIVPVQTTTPPSGCAVTASPATFPAGGGNVTLSVACSGGGAPTSFAWTGGFATGTTATNTRSGSITSTTTFGVTPSNSAGSAPTANVTVLVSAPVVAPSGCALSAAPASLPAGGGNVTLTAACSGGGSPTSFSWTGGFATGTTTTGTRMGTVTTPTTFGVVASNGGGSAPVASAFVDVQAPGAAAPSGCTLTASPATLPAGGGTVMLTATCSGGGVPTTFAWSGGFASGRTTTTGTVSGTAAATTAYSVVAGNAAGNAPPASFTVNVATGAASATTGTAVEYFNATMGHYFLTAFPEEAAALDAGTISGWRRTGYSFPVEMSPGIGTQPVCRFFTTWFAPKSSHFYTPYAAECATLKTGAIWQYEAIAFYLGLPDAAGNCPAGVQPIYRFYNNGITGAPNHRYTSDAIVARVMRAQGWTQEGDAPTGIFACGATPPPSRTSLAVQMEFNPTVRFLTTADGAALTSISETSLTFAKAVPIVPGDVFVVPEIGAWHALSVQPGAGQTTVGVEPATLEELFSVLEISGTVDIDDLPEILPGTAANAAGSLVSKSALEKETETTLVKTTNAAGVSGRKFTTKLQAQCGSNPKNKMRLLEFTGEIYGLPGIFFSLKNPSAALAGPYPWAVTGGAYLGCKVSLPLGELRLLDQPLPYTAGLVRLQVFARARLETDILPVVQLFEIKTEGVFPSASSAPVVNTTNTSLAGQFLAAFSSGDTFTASLVGELDTVLKVIVPITNSYLVGGGVKTGPALEAKATALAKATGPDVNLCFQLKWPTELYTELPSKRGMTHKPRFQSDYPVSLPNSWQQCLAGNEPTGDWRFTPKVCAADPNNNPTCSFQCYPSTDFTLSATPDKSKIDVYFPVGSNSLYMTLKPEGSVRNFTGSATDGATVAVETMQFASDWKSAAWQYVAVYPSGGGVCSYQLGGDAVLITPR